MLHKLRFTTPAGFVAPRRIRAVEREYSMRLSNFIPATSVWYNMSLQTVAVIALNRKRKIKRLNIGEEINTSTVKKFNICWLLMTMLYFEISHE